MIKDISFGDAFKCALGVTLGIRVGVTLGTRVGEDLSGIITFVGGCAARAIIKKILPEEWALILKEYEKEHDIK